MAASCRKLCVYRFRTSPVLPRPSSSCNSYFPGAVGSRVHSFPLTEQNQLERHAPLLPPLCGPVSAHRGFFFLSNVAIIAASNNQIIKGTLFSAIIKAARNRKRRLGCTSVCKISKQVHRQVQRTIYEHMAGSGRLAWVRDG